MTPGAKLLMVNASFSPYRLGNNAAIYSLNGPEGDGTYLTNGSGRVVLVADRSQYSAVNALVVPDVSGSTMGITTGVSLGTGVFTLVTDMQVPLATPSGNCYAAKLGGTTPNTFHCRFESGGQFRILIFGASGADFNRFTLASATTTYAGQRITISVVRKASGNPVIYFNAVDVTASGSFDSSGGAPGWQGSITSTTLDLITSSAGNGSAVYYATRLYSAALSAAEVAGDYTGTLQSGNTINCPFSAVPKLTTSFNCLTGQAVTITPSGDVGTRISGARDLYQATTTKMPALSVVNGCNVATFDTTNDFMRSAPYALAQSITDYYVGSMPAWTSGKYFFDGAAAANTSAVIMTTGTPQLNINAGSSVAANTGLAVATTAVLTATFSGANSALGVNRNAETTGDAGSGTPNGSTLSASGASTAANFAGVTFSEWLRRNVADDSGTKAKIQTFEMKRWAITS